MKTRSNSGLQIGLCVQRSLDCRDKINLVRGFLFVNELGRSTSLKDYEDEILDQVERFQSSFHKLILT